MTRIVIPDGGTIGSASDTDAISIPANGKPTFSAGIANTGTIDAGTLGSSVVVPASIGGYSKLLETYTADGSVTQKVFDISSHTYDEYIVRINSFRPSTNGGHFRLVTGTASDTFYESDDDNYGVKHYSYAQYNSAGHTQDPYDNSLVEVFDINSTGNISGDIHIYNPQSTNFATSAKGHFVCYTTAGNPLYIVQTGGFRSAKTQENFIKVFFAVESSPNIQSGGKAYLYGVKNV